MITSFDGEFRFLSNFYPCTIFLDGVEYPSVENAFQAAKTLVFEKRQEFINITPGKAKRLGRKLELRKDWDIVKISVMKSLLVQKFLDKDLSEKLLSTGEQYIVEGNNWGDVIWGAVWWDELQQWFGENNLGLLLMEVRDEISKGVITE